MDMREHGLSYKATMRKYFSDFPTKNYYFLKQWERIYLTEGAAGFMVERCASNTRPRLYVMRRSEGRTALPSATPTNNVENSCSSDGIGGLSHGGSALLDLPYIGNDVGQRIITVAVI